MTNDNLNKLKGIPAERHAVDFDQAARDAKVLSGEASGATDAAERLGNTGLILMVHKTGEEGALVLDGGTGEINQPIMERPEWAAGLVLAHLAERHQFYISRIGSEAYKADPKLSNPDILNFDDLGWMIVDPDTQEATNTTASGEFRSEVLMNYAGLAEGADGELVHTDDKTSRAAEAEIAIDRTRTFAEQSAFEDAQREGFKEAQG